jgi:hypothetical protein
MPIKNLERFESFLKDHKNLLRMIDSTPFHFYLYAIRSDINVKDGPQMGERFFILETVREHQKLHQLRWLRIHKSKAQPFKIGYNRNPMIHCNSPIDILTHLLSSNENLKTPEP